MAFAFLGPDPLEATLTRVLQRLAEGDPPSGIDVSQVDVKEEPGRRRPSDGMILAGQARNEEAAQYLAGEMACLANTAGGGAIILGVADDGRRIGTELDAEWLRHRVWELTERALTVTVRPGDLDGARLLVLTTHESIEPVRHGGRLRWRLDDHCVEIDPTSWHAGRLQRTGVDWSAQPSGHGLADASPVAVARARGYLRAAGDEGSLDLAAATDEDLLRRLNVVTGDERLTNAGSLLFVGTSVVGIDYIRREQPGGDSTNRLRGEGPLLDQVFEVERAAEATNRVVHLPEGFAHGQRRAIPTRAGREAIVNGAVHRDWLSPHPTTVEHVADTLTVTSPGGFIAGIAPTNIITHPAAPRYRALAEAMEKLRLAEREGIGVDRMVRDMLAIGRPEPLITEIAGPYVRVALFGGEPDVEVLGLLSRIEPRGLGADLDALLVLDHLTRRGWVDVETAAPMLQRTPAEAEAALARVSEGLIDEHPLILAIDGVPPDRPPAYRLSAWSATKLVRRMAPMATPAGREQVVLAWARARGRASSTEVADLTGVSVPYAGRILTGLERDGLLAPGRPQRRGRGFFYVPAGSD